MPSEVGSQTFGWLAKGAFLFFVVIIVLFFVGNNADFELDDHGALGISREFILLNKCLIGTNNGQIDADKLTKEKLRKCGGGVRVTLLDLDENEIVRMDSDDERSIQIPQCFIPKKNIKCMSSRSLVRVVDIGKVDVRFLDVEMVL